LYLFWLPSGTTNKQIREVSFLPGSAYQKWFSKIWAPWVAVYKIQSYRLLHFSWLLSGTTNKQINEGLFLPGSADQKWFSNIWASWAAVYKIQSHTLLRIEGFKKTCLSELVFVVKTGLNW